MAVNFKWNDWLQAMIKPDVSAELQRVIDRHKTELPIVWLLGKTGSGKSSVIRHLTNDSRATIGTGYTPCTTTTMHFDFPSSSPYIRFMDSRGLGEAGYEPSQDLRRVLETSHALLLLTRVDDTEQSDLVKALKIIRKNSQLPTLHLHTHIHRLDEPALSRAVTHNTTTISSALGYTPQAIQLDLRTEINVNAVGLDLLRDGLAALIPELAISFGKRYNSQAEESIFQHQRPEIIAYASAAAASDVLPAFGLIAVPSIQGKMMHALAGRYGQQWNRQSSMAFISLMGSSFLYRYFLALAGRQLSKLIPIYGQTAGAAAAAAISFASTYAIGRALCLFLYKKKYDLQIDQEQLKSAFKDAFSEHLKR